MEMSWFVQQLNPSNLVCYRQLMILTFCLFSLVEKINIIGLGYLKPPNFSIHQFKLIIKTLKFKNLKINLY